MRRRMKGLRSWLALALAVCLLWGCAAALGEEKELLTNGGFERAGAADTPDGWYSSAYRTQQGYTRFAVTGERAHSGEYSAKITNANANDARFVYPVTVEPESMYRFSAWVYVEDMEDEGNGANLAIKDVYAFSDCLFDTQGEWQYLEWYGETDVGQTQVELSVCVGGYGAESVGTAYFDDVSLVKVDTLPDDVYADLWFTVSSGASQQTETDAEETPGKSTVWFVLLALLFAALTLLGRSYLLCGESRPKSGVTLCFALALAAALALRVVLAMTVSGYSVDMNCFAAWSLRMASGGPVNFYDESVFCDYPPGYMLMLWPVGLLLRAVGYGENGVSWLIVKLLPILADMITAIVLFAFAKKRLPEKAAAFVGLLFAFSPAVLVNGAAWGQADTVLSLLILLTVIYAMDRRWRVALPLFIAAVLVKPQALLFAPLGGVWLILSLARDRQRGAQVKDMLIGLGIGALCAAAIIVPFSIRQKPLWLVELYQKTLSSYDYASLNTANLAYLLGGNWSALSAENGAVTLSWALPLVTALLCFAAAAWQSGALTGGFAQRKAGLTGRLRARQPLEQADRRFALSALLALAGLAFAAETLLPCTFLVYGTTWMVVSYLWGILCLVLEPDAKKLPFFMAVTLAGVYVLGIKVHERYLFAALALLLLTYALTRDRRVLWLMVGFSITTFLNTAIVLDNSILYGSSMGHLNADTLVLNDLLCALNLALCGFAFGLCFAGLREMGPIEEEAPREPAAPVYRSELLTPRDAGLHMTGREWLTVCLVTAVYAVLAFTNLGSLKAPQTAWVSTSAEEQAVFELAERSTFKTLYYAGVSYNNFSISVSDDGE
ncbi:MAG: hypothetical protein PHY12_11965, partial [Eubacteriales bacterium]|nr:hypothetical protein [Eubacteriales bacterium]